MQTNNLEKQSELAAKISSMLKPEELKVISLEDLLKAPVNNVLGYCQNVIEWRRVPFAQRKVLDFSPDNEFLSEVSALLIRGVTPAQFLEFDKEKQLAFTDYGFYFRLMDLGVKFEKISKLTAEDLRQLFAWAQSSRERMLNIVLDDMRGHAQTMNELNTLIDNLIEVPIYNNHRMFAVAREIPQTTELQESLLKGFVGFRK